MATAKVIKGECTAVKRVVEVVEQVQQPDKIVLELSQDEVNALRFILGQRLGTGAYIPSTDSVFDALRGISTEHYVSKYFMVGDACGWRVEQRSKRSDC
jgi:hypothetical protein